MISGRDLERMADALARLPVEEMNDRLYERLATYRVAAALAQAMESLTEELRKLREAVSDGGRKEGA